jgi:hypothetical protein
VNETPVVFHVTRKKVRLYRRRHLRAIAREAYKAAALERKRQKSWTKSIDRSAHKMDAALKGCADR